MLSFGCKRNPREIAKGGSGPRRAAGFGSRLGSRLINRENAACGHAACKISMQNAEVAGPVSPPGAPGE